MYHKLFSQRQFYVRYATYNYGGVRCWLLVCLCHREYGE